MKIRAWRPKPMDDVSACGVIKQAVGSDFAVMFDRTAHRPEDAGQRVWDYQTALKVARGLQEKGAYWLEEPFAREDYRGPARLAPDSHGQRAAAHRLSPSSTVRLPRHRTGLYLGPDHGPMSPACGEGSDVGSR